MPDTQTALILSPFMGMFFRALPGEPPFVEVGAHVGAGRVIGGVLVEGLWYEVDSEVAGTVIEFLVDEGDPVDPGDPLVKLSQP